MNCAKLAKLTGSAQLRIFQIKLSSAQRNYTSVKVSSAQWKFSNLIQVYEPTQLGRVGDVQTRPTPTGHLIFWLMRFDVYLFLRKLLRKAQNWSTRKISRNFYKQNFLLNFRIFRRIAKNCESEANSLRFASQKIIWRSLRFRFAIFFEKKFAFASLSQSIFCQNLDPCLGCYVWSRSKNNELRSFSNFWEKFRRQYGKSIDLKYNQQKKEWGYNNWIDNCFDNFLNWHGNYARNKIEFLPCIQLRTWNMRICQSWWYNARDSEHDLRSRLSSNEHQW